MLETQKTILTHLFAVEGKSISYLANIYKVTRRRMSNTLKKEWGLEQAKVKSLSPKNLKLYNQYRGLILEYCESSNERYLTTLYDIIGFNGDTMKLLRSYDPELDKAIKKFTSQESQATRDRNRIAFRKQSLLIEMKDLPGEVWKEILGYEGLYWASTEGRIKSNNQVLKPTINLVSGRPYVTLYNNGKSKNLKVYRLIALTFLPNPDDLPTVNHKNGIITDSTLKNLEWASHADQNSHKLEVLKNKPAIAYGKNGKFKRVKVNNKFEFKTLKATAKFLGVSETTIQRYISGESKTDIKIELIY